MHKYIIILIAVFHTLCASNLMAADIFWADQPNTEEHLVISGKQIIETQVRFASNSLKDAAGFVVFVQGSGTGLFSDNGIGFDIFIQQFLFDQNFAIVYQNKRGTGKSSGTWQKSSIGSRADDVTTVFNYYDNLMGNGQLPAGVIGHSQGGWVVQMLAAQDNNIDFVIALAGPVRDVATQDLYRTSVDAKCSDMTNKQVNQVVKKRKKAHLRMTMLGRVLPYFDLRYMSNILAYDPKEDLKSIQKPLLLVFAGMDSMVDLKKNIERLDRLFPDGLPDDLQLRIIENTDHMFRYTDTICFDYFRNGEYAEVLQSELGQWIGDRLN